jgi:galactose mutarotase-like enzyme
MTDDRTLFHAKPVRMTNATVTSDGRRYDLRDIEGPHTDHGPPDDKEWLVCARSFGRQTQAATATPDWRAMTAA